MYSSKYANISGNAVSEHYYCDGESKAKDSKTDGTVSKSAPLTIFDMPEFVVDAYLDAINGGSSEDAGFRSLSDKYGPSEGNFNCNHGKPDGGCGCPDTKPNPCGCGCPPQKKSDYDGACGPLYPQTPESGGCCSKGSPYEKGATPFEEERKKCGCNDTNPYADGENAFIEPLKVPRCGCDSQPYEEGAFPFKNEYKPPKVNTGKPVQKECSETLPDISKRYPVECSNDEPYTEGESCAVCVRDQI